MKKKIENEEQFFEKKSYKEIIEELIAEAVNEIIENNKKSFDGRVLKYGK